LLPRSSDPGNWKEGYRGSASLGENVADPSGGNEARRINFDANSGYFYGLSPSSLPPNTTVQASVYVRSDNKNQIGLRVVNDSEAGNPTLCSVTSSWQRCTVKVTFHKKSSWVQLGLENRPVTVPGLDGAGGTIDVYGGQIQAGPEVTAYSASD
jgi:hypothetical protein